MYRYKKPLELFNLVNRVRRISTDLLSTYKGKFDTDFEHNKKVLDEVAVIRSKGLKNEIAGYITSYIKRQIEEQNEKESKTATQVGLVDGTEEIKEQILN